MFSVLGSAFYWIIQEEKAWSNNNIIARYRFILKDGNISFCARTATLKPWLAWNTISFVYFIFFPSYFLVAVVVVVTVDLWHTINMCYVSHLYLSKFSWFMVLNKFGLRIAQTFKRSLSSKFHETSVKNSGDR